VSGGGFIFMAINSNYLRRSPDGKLFLAAAVGFPLLILIGYFKSYYFSAFFDSKPLANSLVHLHGVVMTLWVIFFAAQIRLARSKNIRLHRSLGTAGAALAVMVIVVGLLTAYDSHIVRRTSPPGINPRAVALVAVFDMVLFALFFAAAVFYRKRSAEHKTLMLLTAINFLPAALFRLSPVPEKLTILWAYGVPDLLAVGCLIWLGVKHRRLNRVFAFAVLLLIISQPLRIILAGTQTWLHFAARLAE
jgi:hypothetical protein